MEIQWLPKEKLFAVATKKILPVSSVLDIGCGIHPQDFILPKIHICCEPYGEYIQYLQEHYSYDDKYIFLQSTWDQILKVFPPKSIDTVFLIDVIEHLPKKEARKLLKLTEKIVRKQILIFTPLGFVPQFHSDGNDAWGMSGGNWQEHKSGWLPKDFNEDWDIYAAKDFHAANNMGIMFKKPHGAFWAIKTYQDERNNRFILKKYTNVLVRFFGNQNLIIILLRMLKHRLYLFTRKKYEEK